MFLMYALLLMRGSEFQFIRNDLLQTWRAMRYPYVRISKRLGPPWATPNFVDVLTIIRIQNLRRLLPFLARYTAIS